MRFLKSLFPFIALAATALSSCEVYKQHIILQDDDKVDRAALRAATEEIEATYALKPFDQINLEVYVGDGETLVDPEFELAKQIGANNLQLQNRPRPVYNIQLDSTARLPVIGNTLLAGKSLQEAEIHLQEKYKEYFEDPYVIITITSRRATVLAPGSNAIVPLPFEGMNLFEVISQAGGIPGIAKMDRVRIISNVNTDPTLRFVDLSTLTGFQEADLIIRPGDVIYIEPRPLIFRAAFQDIAPILSTLATTTSIVILVLNIIDRTQ